MGGRWPEEVITIALVPTINERGVPIRKNLCELVFGKPLLKLSGQGKKKVRTASRRRGEGRNEGPVVLHQRAVGKGGEGLRKLVTQATFHE